MLKIPNNILIGFDCAHCDVNRVAGAADGIIVWSQPPVSYYLRGTHAVFYGRRDRRFRGISREAGTIDLWSNQRLLTAAEEVRAYAEGRDLLWVVQGVSGSGAVARVEEVLGSVGGPPEQVFVSEDGRLEVLRIPTGVPAVGG